MLTGDKYVFYKDRKDWADVKPIEEDSVRRKVLNIAYSEEFLDAMGYLRAIMMKDERSSRAFELTDSALQLNPANYTAWEYRRRILTSIGSDLSAELRYTSKMIQSNPKNYQVFTHAI